MRDELSPLAADAVDATELGTDPTPVSLHGVSKSFEDVTAVDGIDLDVKGGELLVVLGPSGCGKTTTLRMVAGLTVADTGTIEIGDADVTQTLPQNRSVSMVFQNYALYPHMTVRQNLAFPLGKTDLDDTERDARVEDVATLLEITDQLEKDPDQLSGGQRQRVALGRTIIREPDVFLMDEPLSNLDANLRVRTRALIRDLQQRLGTTTIYVTHDQEEALSIADRLLIMHDGDIVQRGDPETVYTTPVNEFVAEFLGDPPMNIHPITHRDDDGIVLADTISVSAPGLSAPTDAARIGIRPEDVYRVDPDDPRQASDDVERVTTPMAVSVDVVEPLGHSYEVTLRSGDTRLTMLEPTFDATSGDTVHVVFDADRLHAFDESGGRL